MTDYIKREDAIKTIESETYRHDYLDHVIDIIEAIPSADVAPVRHGRWKPFDRTWGRSVFTCSACGECMDVPTEMGKPIFDYCPNCGARMDGDENEID